jgi:CIC family chloride channel protein
MEVEVKVPSLLHLRARWPWRSPRQSLRNGSVQLVILALLIGVGAGFGAVAFRWLIGRATLLFSGSTDYSGTTGHPSHPWLTWLGPAFIVMVPTIGGLIYGPLVDRFAREARGHGVPEVMYAVNHRGGRIPGKVAVVKTLASALTIGSGGSVGREGPIVQIGSAMGSTLGRWARVPESRLRTLVACGAAGGIAATFNAPIAGVFFALELILLDFAATSFGTVVLASVTAAAIGRTFLGDAPFLSLPPFTVSSPREYLLYALLGVFAAAVGIGFTKILYGMEDFWDGLWRGPEWLRPGVGGLALGALLLFLPELYGVGYPVLERGIAGQYVVAFLLVLLVGKIVATSLTIGIGGSGGVFAPSLFMGAMLGAAFGQVAANFAPGLNISPGAYALVAMGAVFAGATRAPITSVIILFELTGEYTIILPLMLAVVVATGISRKLSPDTIYTLKLKRRGVKVGDRELHEALSALLVGDEMGPAPQPLHTRMVARDAAKRLLATRRGSLPVETNHGTFIGVITSSALAGALATDVDAGSLTVSQLVEMPTLLSPDMTVDEALDAMLGDDAGDGLPVVDKDGQLCGWLGHDTVLRVVASSEP